MKNLIAVIALGLAAWAADASAQTATYGGRTYTFRAGRTSSGGRVVNPFGPRVRSYSSPSRRGGVTATYGGRTYTYRSGRTYSAGRPVSRFGPRVRSYHGRMSTPSHRITPRTGYRSPRTIHGARGMRGSRGLSPYSSAYRNQQLLQQQARLNYYRRSLGDALGTYRTVRRGVPASGLGGVAGAARALR